MSMTEGFCDVCGLRNSYGCGHSGEHRRDARRHNATKEHREGRCWHYDHTTCDPSTCKLAGAPWPIGYMPFVKHADVKPRGSCLVCARVLDLQDGRVIEHGHVETGECPGSNQPPSVPV